MNAVAAPPAPDLGSALINLTAIDPSPMNPRQNFEPIALEEMAASMRTYGVLEPLVLRLKPGVAGRYEIVAGERRWRAAKLAALDTIPASVRILTDLQVAEIQLVENHQRKDIHPIEEAEGFAHILRLDKSQTPRTIGQRIGMSERYVQNRLHYLKLVKEVREAFLEDRITSGHADLLGRLKAEDQKKAFAACFAEDWGGYDSRDTVRPLAVDIDEPNDRASGPRKPTKALVSVRDLDHWIKGSVRLQLEAKGPEMEFLPGVRDAVAAAQAKDAPKLIEITDAYDYFGKDKPGPITRRDWRPLEKKKCEHAQRAVIVLGHGRGEVLDVCLRASGCKVHFPPEPSYSRENHHYKRPASEIRAERQRRLWGKVKKLAIDAAVQRTPEKLTPGVLQVLAFGVQRWHYNGRKVTLRDVVRAAAEHAAFLDQASFQSRIAKPLGLNLKPLFATAAPKKKPKAAPKPRARKAGRKK